MSLVAILSVCVSNQEPETKPTAGTTKKAPTPSVTPTEDPTLEEAKGFAIESGKRFGARDFGGSWDQWDKASKAVVPRDDYVAYAEACDLGGVPLKVADVRLDSNTSATVRYEVMGYVQARTLLYEDGHWRAKTTTATLKLFADGTVDGAVAAAKASGGCG